MESRPNSDAVQKQLAVFGNKLQMTRVAKGITQRKLSEMSGVSTDTIRSVERGHRTPKFETVVRLLVALGYKINFELP